MNNRALSRLRAALGNRLGSRWIQVLLALKTEHRFAEHYGEFHFSESYDRQAIELTSILVYGIPEPSHDDQAARFC